MTPRFRSIVSRILWLHVIGIGGAAFVMPVALYALIVFEIDHFQRQTITEQAQQIARHLELDASGRLKLDLPESVSDVFSEAYGRYSYSVIDHRGLVRFSSRNDFSSLAPKGAPVAEANYWTRQIGGTTVFGATVPATVAGRMFWVEATENLSHRDVIIDDVVASFFTRVGWITVPILLLLLAIDVVIVRMSFRPIINASREAAEIGPSRPDVRLRLKGIPDEIHPLVVAVNEALDRLSAGYRRQREFAADAAHELRTPLAILRTRIETLPDAEISAQLRRDVEAMSRTVSQLLDMTEIETLRIPADTSADLLAVCREVISLMAPIVLAEGKTISLTGCEHSVWVQGDAEMITRALRNLIENAVKHTPRGSMIDVALEPAGSICISDDGLGIPPNQQSKLFHRFWRADRKGASGAGLGLSIVQRVMDAHNGTVEFRSLAPHGAEFMLRFNPVSEANRRAEPPGENYLSAGTTGVRTTARAALQG